jgi:hypothetical protein
MTVIAFDNSDQFTFNFSAYNTFNLFSKSLLFSKYLFSLEFVLFNVVLGKKIKLRTYVIINFDFKMNIIKSYSS